MSSALSARIAAATPFAMTRRIGTAASSRPAASSSIGSVGTRRTTLGVVTVRAASSSSSSSEMSSAKVCVITGANTGLGFIAAREIAKKPGYKVVMACRDATRAANAAKTIAEEIPGADVDASLTLDLASLSSVERFAAAFDEKYGRLDVLMNNAGVMALPNRETTEDGLEMQMGVNHHGHFALTSRLMPTVLRTPGRKRIVNVSSVAHEWGHIDFDNINSDGFFGYLGAYHLTLVPIRPRSRGARRSLSTYTYKINTYSSVVKDRLIEDFLFPAVVSLRPGSLAAFNPDTPRRLSTPSTDPLQPHPDIHSLVWTIDPQAPGG